MPSSDKQKSSLVTIFTLCNVMVGASILTMPYSFYNSGLLIGFTISFLSFVFQMRTCILIVRSTLPHDDYYDTIRKYWGPVGFYLYVGGTMFMA